MDEGAPENTIYTVGGAVQATNGRYIARRADDELLALCRAGTFAAILAARQMGKSSLMLRTAERLAAEGVRTAQIDLTLIGTQLDAERWFFGLLFVLRRQLALRLNLLDWWREHAALSPTQRFSLFCEDVLLREVAEPLVIFIDEIDTTLSLDFTDDFYAAVRGLFMARAHTPKLARLSFVLIGVATPGDLVRDPKRTPFNIGARVEMTDFSFDEALPLAEGLGLPNVQARQLLGWVLAWTGGHPYLTQRLCQTAAEADVRFWTAANLAALVHTTFFATRDEQDHNLQFVRDMLTQRAPDVEAVLTTYRAVRRARSPIYDDERSLIKAHLKLSGIVRRDAGVLHVRNRIYRTVFDDRWVRAHLPVHWARQLRRALRVITSLIALLLVLGALTIYALFQQREAERQRTLADAQAATAVTAQQLALAAQATAEARRQEAEQQGRVALAREVAANAVAQAPLDSERALLLAIAAEGIVHTEQGEAALRTVLLGSPLRQIVRGHSAPVRAVAFSPDGKQLATTSEDGTARLWEAGSGTLRRTLRSAGAVTCLAWSPDATRVATGGADGTVRLWDARSGERRATLNGHTGGVNSIVFSADGARLLSASVDGTARLWDVTSGALLCILQGHTGDVIGAHFSLDGAQAVTFGADATAQVWDIAALGRQSDGALAQPVVLAGHVSVVSSAAFRFDGEQVATASYDGSARVWDARSGREVTLLQGHTDRVASVAFSPDGRWVVTASKDRTARLWDAATGTLLSTLQGHRDALTGARFSPDGEQILTSSQDGTAVVWDRASGQQRIALHGHADAVVAAVFSPDGSEVATASADGTARLWEADAKQLDTRLSGHTRGVNDVGWSPDGALLATAGEDATVRLWPLHGAGSSVTLPKACPCPVHAVAFSPNGALVAAANDDATLEVWGVRSHEQRLLIPTKGGKLLSVAFSLDSRMLVTGGEGQIASVWDVATGVLLLRLQEHRGSITDVAFNPDGTQVVTASADGTARIWDTATGEVRATLAHAGAVVNARFSPNGTQLVTVADGTARLWDVRSSMLLKVLAGGQGSVTSVSFSADGQRVAIAGANGAIGIVDVRSGEQRVVPTAATDSVTRIAFSPDGAYLAAAGADGGVHMYRWELFALSSELLARARSHVMRTLTCAEQQQFLHVMSCEAPRP